MEVMGMEDQGEYVYKQWIEWFWVNSDFGPAHSDVVCCMMAEFEKETGEILPNSVTEGYR
jgi:hypothetical protein